MIFFYNNFRLIAVLLEHNSTKVIWSSKYPQTQVYSEYYYIVKILQVDKNALLKKHSAAGAAGSNLISFSSGSTLAANFVFVLKVSIKKCLTVKVQRKITSKSLY